MADERGQIERWRYIGQRQTNKGGLAYFWIDEAGEEHGFRKGRALPIGATYEVRIERDADGGLALIGNPKFAGAAEPGDELTAGWDLEDRGARATDELRKREQRAKRDTHLGELTLDQAREQLARKFGPSHTAMLAELIRYLQGSS